MAKMKEWVKKAHWLSTAGLMSVEYCRSFKGYSKERIAKEIGVDYNTLMRWAKEDKRLAKALDGKMSPIAEMLLGPVLGIK